eukprot:1159065-Pelagomonas_calceolata.AAC.3
MGALSRLRNKSQRHHTLFFAPARTSKNRPSNHNCKPGFVRRCQIPLRQSDTAPEKRKSSATTSQSSSFRSAWPCGSHSQALAALAQHVGPAKG